VTASARAADRVVRQSHLGATELQGIRLQLDVDFPVVSRRHKVTSQTQDDLARDDYMQHLRRPSHATLTVKYSVASLNFEYRGVGELVEVLTCLPLESELGSIYRRTQYFCDWPTIETEVRL